MIKVMILALLFISNLKAETYDCTVLSTEENFQVWQDDNGADVPLELRFEKKTISGQGYFNDDNIDFTSTDSSIVLVWRYDDQDGYLESGKTKEKIYCRYDYLQFEKP
jgi:hypothetical protein